MLIVSIYLPIGRSSGDSDQALYGIWLRLKAFSRQVLRKRSSRHLKSYLENGRGIG